jgi:hypothetical protein
MAWILEEKRYFQMKLTTVLEEMKLKDIYGIRVFETTLLKSNYRKLIFNEIAYCNTAHKNSITAFRLLLYIQKHCLISKQYSQ